MHLRINNAANNLAKVSRGRLQPFICHCIIMYHQQHNIYKLATCEGAEGRDDERKIYMFLAQKYSKLKLKRNENVSYRTLLYIRIPTLNVNQYQTMII